MAMGGLVPAWDRAGLEPCWADPGTEVFVLGAGFSIAASSTLSDAERFPDTAGLGRRAVDALKPKARTEVAEAGWPGQGIDGMRFEAWLAGLAEDQPYLSTEGNLRRQALYTEVVRAMRPVLVECEERVAADPPAWLLDLVSVWHVRQAQVLTFNYDTLVERCLDHLELSDADEERTIGAGDVLDGIPPAANDSWRPTGAGAATFRLVKLHGSTSWFWVPGDLTGTTVLRLDPTTGAGEGDPDVQAERSRLLLGRDPFIVPPVTTKAPLYANPVTKELWNRARHALRESSRVTLVGYSFPPVDTTAAGLIADTLAGRSNVSVEVVDLKAADVARELQRAGIAVPESACHPGLHAVERFVAGYVQAAARHVVDHLRSWRAEHRGGVVRVVWGSPLHPSHLSDVIIKVDKARRVLVVTPVGNSSTHLSEFLDALPVVDEIIVSGDQERRVVDWVPTAQARVAGGPPTVDTWFANLLPAGPSPQGLAPSHHLARLLRRD